MSVNEAQEQPMDRRAFVRAGVIAGTAAMGGVLAPHQRGIATAGAHAPGSSTAAVDFGLAEATIDQLQGLMRSGAHTARSITEQYLARIDAMDQQGLAVNAIIELNPDALAIADRLDTERKSKEAARPAAWDTGSHQGQHRHAGQNAGRPQGRWPSSARARLEDAFIVGSLALSGYRSSWGRRT